jgi:hypothetical protein
VATRAHSADDAQHGVPTVYSPLALVVRRAPVTAPYEIVRHTREPSVRKPIFNRLPGVRVIGRHTALGDALVTGEIFLRLLPLLAALGIVTLRQALDASRETYRARLTY